jgi:hypothetical protein
VLRRAPTKSNEELRTIDRPHKAPQLSRAPSRHCRGRPRFVYVTVCGISAVLRCRLDYDRLLRCSSCWERGAKRHKCGNRRNIAFHAARRSSRVDQRRSRAPCMTSLFTKYYLHSGLHAPIVVSALISSKSSGSHGIAHCRTYSQVPGFRLRSVFIYPTAEKGQSPLNQNSDRVMILVQQLSLCPQGFNSIHKKNLRYNVDAYV